MKIRNLSSRYLKTVQRANHALSGFQKAHRDNSPQKMLVVSHESCVAKFNGESHVDISRSKNSQKTSITQCTLQGTNISPLKVAEKMIFLFSFGGICDRNPRRVS